MSVFTGGEKYYRLAEGVDARAYHLEEEISHMQTNRELLAEIRKARLAASQQEFAVDQTSGEYISNTGQTAATANIYSTFAGAYGYSMGLSNMSKELQDLDLLSHTLKKKGASADKKAATATQITMAVFAVAGGAIGAALASAAGGMSATVGAGLGVAAGGATGAAGVRAAGGGKVARKVANKAAINYAITGATIAAGGALAGGAGAGGGSGATTGGTVEMAGGISKDVTAVGGQTFTGATVAAPTAAAPSTSTAWLSSAKQIGEGLSMANQIRTMVTPDYSYVEDKYKRSLYRQRYNRIYA